MSQSVLEAIIILDSCCLHFEPFSTSRAECLLPILTEKTLLDASLEFLLETNQFEHVYLAFHRHIDEIKKYIKKSRWRKKNLKFIECPKSQSVCDYLREIKTQQIVKSSSFLLMTATGVVSNLSLGDNLAKHLEITKLGNEYLMTVLCVPKLEDLTIDNKLTASAKESSVSLPHGFANFNDLSGNCFKCSVPSKMLLPKTTTSKSYPIKQSPDICEARIYICNLEFLDSLDENVKTIDEFINKQIETNKNNSIRFDTISTQFGSHISLIDDLKSYFNECMRLLTRADLTLERCFFKYTRDIERLNVYLSKSTTQIGDRSKFGRNVLIDANCQIGDSCELENCWVGKNCHIGSNVKLTNTIVGKNCRIGSNSSINACILGLDVELGNDVKISENSVLGNGIKVNNNTIISEPGVYSALDTILNDNKENNLLKRIVDEKTEHDFKVWKVENYPFEIFYNSDDELAEIAKISDEEFEMDVAHKHKSPRKTFKQDTNIDKFCNDIEKILSKSDKTNDFILEVWASRQNHDIQIDDFYFYLGKSLFRMTLLDVNDIEQILNLDFLNRVSNVLDRYSVLIKNVYCRRENAQKQLLKAIFEFFIDTNESIGSSAFSDKFFPSSIHLIYRELDFLMDPKVIMEWFENQTVLFSNNLPERKSVLKNLTCFIHLLKYLILIRP